MQNHNLTNPFQSGFKKQHSTTTALIHVTDEISWALDRGEVVCLVLLDYSGAFSSVNHEILLATLKSINFDDTATAWFRSYLEERVQATKVGDLVSLFSTLPNGLMQGTILSPWCYSKYTDSLPSCLTKCLHHVFADDFQIYHSFKASEAEQAIADINADLDRVVRWSEKHCLKLNPLKSQAILIGAQWTVARLHNSLTSNILINGVPITFEKDSVKNLGVYIDGNLDWSAQINNTCRKVNKCLYPLNRIRNFLPCSIKKNIISTLITPLFDYGNILTSNSTNHLSSRLHRTMNSCIRFIFNSKRRENITPFYKNLTFLTTDQRKQYHALLFLYKVTHNKMPQYITNKFTRLHSERNGILYEIPRHRTARHGQSTVIYATRLWNRLPQRIRAAKTVSTFKNLLRSYFLDSV